MSMCITIEKMYKLPNVTQEKLHLMSSDGYDYIIIDDCFGKIPNKVKQYICNIPLSYFNIDKIKRDNNISDDFELVGYGCLDDKFDFDFGRYENDDYITKKVVINDKLLKDYLYNKETNIVVIKELVYIGGIGYIGDGFKDGKNPFFDGYKIPTFIDTIDGLIKILNDILTRPDYLISELDTDRNRNLLSKKDTIIFISS